RVIISGRVPEPFGCETLGPPHPPEAIFASKPCTVAPLPGTPPEHTAYPSRFWRWTYPAGDSNHEMFPLSVMQIFKNVVPLPEVKHCCAASTPRACALTAFLSVSSFSCPFCSSANACPQAAIASSTVMLYRCFFMFILRLVFGFLPSAVRAQCRAEIDHRTRFFV